ncbi:MAG: hypothetical protein JST68_11540 [Bacteroidetes bacterium]|nr:hypothetical protein [Bacteroidota bacterium]
MFGCLFMFDDPNVNVPKMAIYCILVNCYPLALVLLSWLSFKLYGVNPILATVLPVITILIYCGLFILGVYFA